MRFSKTSPISLVGHAGRVQIHVAELGDDKIKDVRLAHLLDFVVELEILEDAADVGGEAIDVAGQVLVDVVGVAFEFLEVERRVVVEALAGGLVEEVVEGVVVELAALAALVLAQNLLLGRREHAVEPAQHGHAAA